MKKILIFIFIVSISVGFAQTKTSQINSMPGAFSRLGFGARGIGMGNAMSAVTDGNLVSYYNPAVPVFQENNSVQMSYTFLTLDRSLNFLSFTRKFEFKTKKNPITGEQKVRSAAGISAGIINSGVSKIDGRDNQGNKTGDLSTSENQFFLSFANRFSERVSVGIAAKFYYYRLYDKINSSGVGLDLGALIKLTQQLNLSLMLSDINSTYKWDTSPIYDTQGNTTENKFPILKKIGLSYKINNPNIIAAVEFESSNGQTNYLRFGAEYNIFEPLYLRAGLDKLNLSNTDTPVRPSFGFTFFKPVNDFLLGINYAFVIEPYSTGDQHILGVDFNF